MLFGPRPLAERPAKAEIVALVGYREPNAPDDPLEATLAAYRQVVDDAVAELAWQANIPPHLLRRRSQFISVPRSIIDFGNPS